MPFKLDAVFLGANPELGQEAAKFCQSDVCPGCGLIQENGELVRLHHRRNCVHYHAFMVALAKSL